MACRSSTARRSWSIRRRAIGRSLRLKRTLPLGPQRRELRPALRVGPRALAPVPAERDHFLQDLASVAGDPQLDGIALADLGGIDVHVNDARLLGDELVAVAAG